MFHMVEMKDPTQLHDEGWQKQGFEWGNPTNPQKMKLATQMLKPLGPPEGLKVLDYGCGDAIMTRYFDDAGFQAHAIDISQTVIDHNREILPEVQFELVTPGAPTPFPDNYFDVIFSSEVIEHLYDVDFVFNEFSRMLKPGGRLILTTPYHGVLKNLVIALFYFEQHYSLTWQHIRFYTKKSLGNMCRSHGLNPISWKSVGRVPFLARSFFLTCEKMS